MGNIPKDFEKRRYEMRKEYTGIDEDIEAIPNPYQKNVKFIPPPAMPLKPPVPSVANCKRPKFVPPPAGRRDVC